MDDRELRAKIEAAFADREKLKDEAHARAVEETVARLDRGELRVAEMQGDAWVTHAWIKQAILLFFAIRKMETIEVGPFEFHDKIPLKKNLAEAGVRVVPPGVVRYGAFVERGAIVMPGYVNIGARVGAGTMVDTWATVGSGAQIGKNVHLSGGAGIGGVLEPPNAVPVVVEDEAMVGSRCMVVGGARVRQGAMLGAGAILTPTTHVIDTETGAELPLGEAPAWSVCVGGTRPRTFRGGTFGLPCLLVLKRLPEGVRHDKSALNAILRDHGVDA